jgi:lysophospholipase L1-like esterase
MADLDRQASLAVGRGVDYVTVLMGANDACTATTGAMTPVATYRRQLDAALATLRGGLPNARILVLSVPDVEHLWRLFRDDDAAKRRVGDVPHLPVDARAAARVDRGRPDAPGRGERAHRRLQRRARGGLRRRQRSGLRALPLGRGLLHDTAFTREQVSHLDFFHPSAAGQRELADRAWAIGFPFADTAAPQTTISGEAPDLTFAADEDATFACRLDGAPWAPCSSPLRTGPLAYGSHELEVRATDRAGNSEPVAARRWWWTELELPRIEITPLPEVRIDLTAPAVAAAPARAGRPAASKRRGRPTKRPAKRRKPAARRPHAPR